jgi:hypothetical protein
MRVLLYLSFLAVTAVRSGTALALEAANGVVLQWNSSALQAVRNTRMAPPIVARALAITHTSIYDAWAAYDPVAVETRFGGSLRCPAIEQTAANKQEAISYAAYRVLVDLFPTERARLFDPLMRALGYDPLDISLDTSTAAGIGNTVAGALLDYRHYDGSNQLAAYADYTHYQPVNTAETLNDPNRWQPVPIFNGTSFVVPKFLVPHWGRVTPFALNDGNIVRPPMPAQYPHGSYIAQANHILHLNAHLTDTEKMISEYWSDGPSSETPPGHWNLLAQWVSRRDQLALDRNVLLFFALNDAMLDASIAVWDCKRAYDSVRPISAIRFLYKGKKILAWAGPNQGSRVINGEDWIPYQPATFITPPFAEYVSGHSTFSAAGAEILRLFTGSSRFGASVTLPPYSSHIEPDSTPREPVTLSWATFSDAADQAGMSRRYGGIHFEDGDLQGRAMGRSIASIVWAKALIYMSGTAAR